MATVTNLRETLKEVAAAINPDEDVVMLYLAGPPQATARSTSRRPPLELLPLSPAVLRTLLDEAGIVWRIVVVSSCHSAAFVDALKSETTLVLAAAGDDATAVAPSSNGSTRLGARALRRRDCRTATRCRRLSRRAQAELKPGAPPIGQLFIGSEIERQAEGARPTADESGAGRRRNR